MSINDLAIQWQHAASACPRRSIRVHTSNQETTYEELRASAARVASALGAEGLGIGARIGLLLPTSLEFIACFMGIIEGGRTCVPLPADVLLGAATAIERVRFIAQDVGLDALIVPDTVPNDRVRMLAPEGLLVLRPASLLLGGRGAPRLGEPESAELALIQYTSGSTSMPKGVALTASQVASGVAAIYRGSRCDDRDVNAQWLPLHHDMGLIGLLAGLAVGTEHHLWSPEAFIRRPAEWLAGFGRLGASIYTGPNFSYARMLARVRDEDLAQLDLRKWRVAFNGAEPIEPSCLTAFMERFARVGFASETMLCVYGMAEATLAVTFPALGSAPLIRDFDRSGLNDQGRALEAKDPSADARSLACVGGPVEGLEVRIVSPENRSLHSAGQVGVIEVRGRSLMTSYYGRTREESGISPDGWFSTGDLGFLGDGGLYVTGRLKEMVIVNGRNYYPQDVELLASKIQGIYQGHVVAVGHPTEERVLVLCEIEQGAEAAALIDAIRGVVRDSVGLTSLDVHACAPRTLPRTTSGKFQRARARELWSSGRLGTNPRRYSPVVEAS